MATAEVKRYWSAVAALGCQACRSDYETTIHHVHGGSCKGFKGTGMKSSDWLVIGLCFDHHTGKRGIDSGMGVQTWEGIHGPQLLMLFRVGLSLGINTFEKAGVDLSRLYDSSCSGILRQEPPAWALER
jgi:hypothetical protein